MIGRTIGRYRIDAELGRGGMGVVYRAIQTTLDRTVAIKMLSPELAGSGDHLARFRREAEVLARLQHENIVHIYDVEEVGGTFCIIMEYVAGPSLGEVLAREGVLAPGAVRQIGVELTAGLEAAHRKGIVHRDLKPDNILFTPEGRPRITDFGIARIATADVMARTRTGVLIGTPYYMSPEQARGSEITGASDIYSLGVLLFQLLSGRVPFQGADPISLAIKHMQEPAPSLSTTMPGLPGPFVALVARALEKEPHRRFGSAAEMGLALRGLELEPAASLAFVSADALAAAVECPECSFSVHAAFVTCPRCALPLRTTAAGAAAVERHPEGRATARADAPVTARADAPGGVPHTSATAGHGETSRADTADGPLARILAWSRAPGGVFAGAGALDWSEAWQAATRPRGPWGVPALLWAGLGIVAAGLVLGLLGVPLRGTVDRVDLTASGSSSGVVSGSGGSADVAGASGAGASRGSPGTALPAAGGATLLPRERANDGPGAAADDAAKPAADDASGGDDAARERNDGRPANGEDRENPPPPDRDEDGPGDVEGAGSGSALRVDETGGSENLPRGFDIERARRELVAIVERQQRATETGDADLFVRDLTPELATRAAADLAGLHRAWAEITSELWNLTIYFEDGTRARFDFHTRLSGTPTGRGSRRVIQDTHVYWRLAYRGGRWVIIEATSGSH